MAQRIRYWSCSPFADWVRGTKKLSVGTSEQWDEWTTSSQMKHNFRYWLAEEGLSMLQDFVYSPIDLLYSVKYYVNNRWVSRTHSLTAHPRDIKPGQWRDVGNRFLPCLFNELVDFVEIETSWSHIAWGNAETRAKYDPPFWASGWFRWRTWRSAQAGLDHLDWEMTLTHDSEYYEAGDPMIGQPTPQAIKARELKELYLWWTTVYPNRPDPYDVSGWSEYCEKSRELNGGRLLGGKKTPELEALATTSLQSAREIEAEYEAEDTAMLIRLIKIRDSLWT